MAYIDPAMAELQNQINAGLAQQYPTTAIPQAAPAPASSSNLVSGGRSLARNPNAKTFKDSKGNIRQIGTGKVVKAVKQPTQKIFLDGQRYSAANSAYDSSQGGVKGFVRNPKSPTGWSFVDNLGRQAYSRAPMRGERVISAQQIQRLNPNFYTGGSATAKLPWLQGFSGGNGWAQTTDGGWYNTDTGQYWKTGNAVPGGRPNAGDINAQQSAIYQSLIEAFKGL